MSSKKALAVLLLMGMQASCVSTSTIVNYDACNDEDRTYTYEVMNTVAATLAAGAALSAGTFLTMKEDTPSWAVAPILPVFFAFPIGLTTGGLWYPAFTADRDLKHCLMMKAKLREDLARMCKDCAVEVTKDE